MSRVIFPSRIGSGPVNRRRIPAAAIFLPGLLALLAVASRLAAAPPPHDPRLDAPLVEAAVAGDAAKVKDLLDRGADPKACNRLGWPASTLAACRGHTEVLRRLYERDFTTADQNAPGRWTPLIEAAAHDHLDTVRFLLACHVAEDAGNVENHTAEEYAHGSGYRDIVAAIRQAGGEPPEPDATGDNDDDSPLVTAAADGDTDALARLLDRGGSVETRSSGGRTLLICATKKGRTEVVRLLLARHADPNALSLRGNSPLDFATDLGQPEIVKLLLEAGADPNGFRARDSWGDTYSPLFQSFRTGRIEVVRLLLDHGARLQETNNIGTTALMDAARRPHPDVLALLIERGQSVNAANRFGYTALMCAAAAGCEENVRFLLGKGADLHAKGKNRHPERHTGQPYGALEAAQINGEPFVTEILLDAGATPANAGAKLTGELFAGIDGKDYELVQAALHKGASANDADADNRLPLEVAVLEGDPGIVKLLLKAGANPNASPVDTPTATPLSDAHERHDAVKDPSEKANYARIIDLLQQAHATR